MVRCDKRRAVSNGAQAAIGAALFCCGCGTLGAADTLGDVAGDAGADVAADPSADPQEQGGESSNSGAEGDATDIAGGPGAGAVGDTPNPSADDMGEPGSEQGGEDAPGEGGEAGEEGAPALIPHDLNEMSRLTRAEYRATIESAFGIWTNTNSIPEDGRVGPFTSNILVTPDPVHPYLLAAEELAFEVLAAGYAVCSAQGAESCLDEEYRDAVERLYRRPIEDDEVAAWADTLQELEEQGASSEEATRAVVASLVLSPDFIYRSALGMRAESWGLRAAERLSYALWDAAPDQELFDAARDAGDASTLVEQARRLSEDERSVGVLARFVAQWLEVDTDLRLEDDGFGESAEYLELLASVRRALDEQTPISEFVAGRIGAVHRGNADFYGLSDVDPDAGQDVAFVTWEEDEPRRGLLAQDLFISSTRHPDVSRREIFRGLLVRRALLCDAIPAPSADLVALAGEVGDRKEDARCAGCHLLLDPVGVAFSVLDADIEQPTVEAELLGHEELEGNYENIGELLEAVAQSQAFAECFSRHWLSFFLERPEHDLDEAWVAALADEVHEGASLSAVVEATTLRLVTESEEMTPWCSAN